MAADSLRERCFVNTNREMDTFVGIRCTGGEIRVQFPLGFALPEEERELQRDIFLLLHTLRRTTERMDSRVQREQSGAFETAFPMQAYLAVLLDFFERGYYRERETVYQAAKRGKIQWGRTIRTIRPCVQERDIFWLDFITRQSRHSERELITRIHEYCVYESFAKAGWLFLSGMPEIPRVKLQSQAQRKLFLRTLREKLSQTFDDKNRRLFRSMTAILLYQGDAGDDGDFLYGTDRFEYVWERLIDQVYGVKGKEEFFPGTTWRIGRTESAGSHLMPDTIMVYRGDVYVLDAKYYKYGATLRPGDLPESASVHKQITYGEYIAMQRHFVERYGEGFQIYNAFLMPFNAKDPRFAGDSGFAADDPRFAGDSQSAADGPLLRIGEAVSDWKANDRSYERVQGILVDVRYLMQRAAGADAAECGRLADCIRRYVDGMEDGSEGTSGGGTERAAGNR